VTASELADRLHAKPTGPAAWMAKCPAHDDAKASLGIAEGKDSRILLKCYAACRTTDIVAALGMKMADLAGNSRKKSSPPKVVETYEYEDEQHEVLYEVVRYEPKDFKQRRPDGKGGWTWKLGDVRRVIFALSTVRLRLKDEGAAAFRREHQLPDAVFVCEGEKDANRLMCRGLIATCNVGGAGKWNDDYTKQLVEAGAKNIVILPDNDDPGRHHAEMVARSCHAAGLTVKVVALPDLPAKGDVSNFLHQQGDIKVLLGIVAATPMWTPAGTVVTDTTKPLAAILTDTQTLLTKYIVLSEAQAITSTLWTAHTHAIAAFDTTPYLQVGSATKRSGKTRFLEVQEQLVPRPWLTGRTSAAALVRKVDADTPTLLLDESDAAFKGEKEYAEALRGILNSGYKRSGRATVCTGKGADIKAQDFSTFCPKAIAGIGKLPDTVADRSIPITLQRRMATEPIARWRDRDGRAAAAPIRQALERWASSAETIEALRAARPDLPGELGDRQQDVWEPLLAIADLAGDSWPARARQAAKTLMGTAEDTDKIVELLTDMMPLVMQTTGDIVPSKTIIETLVALEDRPWATFRRDDKPLTTHGLARLLAELKIHPGLHRVGAGDPVRGYRRDALQDAVLRYLPPQVFKCYDANKNGPEPRNTSPSEPVSEKRNCNAETSINTGAVTLEHLEAGETASEGSEGYGV
jgi:hypothetical protein